MQRYTTMVSLVGHYLIVPTEVIRKHKRVLMRIPTDDWKPFRSRRRVRVHGEGPPLATVIHKTTLIRYFSNWPKVVRDTSTKRRQTHRRVS